MQGFVGGVQGFIPQGGAERWQLMHELSVDRNAAILSHKEEYSAALQDAYWAGRNGLPDDHPSIMTIERLDQLCQHYLTVAFESMANNRTRTFTRSLNGPVEKAREERSKVTLQKQSFIYWFEQLELGTESTLFTIVYDQRELLKIAHRLGRVHKDCNSDASFNVVTNDWRRSCGGLTSDPCHCPCNVQWF
jgi:hypothetical protein